jgi:hypothetical protein
VSVDDLATVTERLKQNRADRTISASATSSSVAASPLLTAAGFLPGNRVFDTVSGLEGVVVDGTRQNVVVPTAK